MKLVDSDGGEVPIGTPIVLTEREAGRRRCGVVTGYYGSTENPGRVYVKWDDGRVNHVRVTDLNLQLVDG